MPINMPAPCGGTFKCGSCKWFRYPIRGKTCRETREVALDTPACVEFQPDKIRPYAALESDKFIKDMEDNMEVYSKEYLVSVGKEVKDYHIFDHKKLDPRSYMAEEEMLALANRFEKCQAYSERVVELKEELKDQRGQLLELLKNTQGYLFSHYTDVMRTLKNDTERGMFQRAIIPKLSSALDRLDTMIDKLTTIQTSLKDAHFAMRETSAAAQVIWNTKGQSMSTGKLSRL